MSGRSSSSGQGYGSRGSGGEQSVKYRDSAAEPRAGEGREHDYHPARHERSERDKLRTLANRR
ncbi:hypothetical protein BofuT4_P145480.1 [Botrytis cinerea T4]|uniref:Uncharacterized protein n=1 Tax=Botryotinia fuckeliana (strain T4) TaxID=999810 RepID=G2YXN1_BOTF4|nr:hypothetical protein BofuT4_P145480.1 [Botrytis cinerea T4]